MKKSYTITSKPQSGLILTIYLHDENGVAAVFCQDFWNNKHNRKTYRKGLASRLADEFCTHSAALQATGLDMLLQDGNTQITL